MWVGGPTAVWARNEKLICFNVKTILTFFTKTIPYITHLVIQAGLNNDQVALEIEIFGKITWFWLIEWTFTFYLVLYTIHDVYVIYHGLLSSPNPF